MRRYLVVLAFAYAILIPLACGSEGPSEPASPNDPGTPVDNDPDDDGILNSVDQCPTQAEVQNGWVDEDGCPDNTLDFYQIVRFDLEEVWTEIFDAAGGSYLSIDGFYHYSQPIDACGGTLPLNNAFYCRLNHSVYYHREFLDEYLVQIGDAAPAVIIAHEVGHHVSQLLGFTNTLYTTKFLELQADCWAGVYAHTVDLRGLLETQDIDEALALLVDIGDPAFTWFDPTAHGTADQRIAAFTLGFTSGDRGSCMTLTEPEEGNQAPLADAGEDISVADQNGDGSEEVTLDGSGSVDTDGTIVSYVWSENASEFAWGPTPTVTLGARLHTITLTVTDDEGAVDTDTVSVNVMAGPATGTLYVRTTTSGFGRDDHYTWSLDGNVHHIGADETVVNTGVPVGDHIIELGDVADNCVVSGENPRPITIHERTAAWATFEVVCQ